MTKKSVLFLIVCLLIASVCTFVSCNGEANHNQNSNQEKLENLVYNGDFELDDDTDVIRDGCSELKIVSGKGIGGSHALEVNQIEDYGTTYIKLTPEYAPGRNYYVSAWVKEISGSRQDTPVASISYTVVSGSVYKEVARLNAEGIKTPAGEDYEYYDIGSDEADIYGHPLMSNDEAFDEFGIVTTAGDDGVDISTDKYVQVSAVIPAAEIKAALESLTEYYPRPDGDTEEPTLAELLVCIFVGDYDDEDGQAGYKYYLDNVEICNLNPEIAAVGKTYKPAAEEEEEELEEEEEV